MMRCTAGSPRSRWLAAFALASFVVGCTTDQASDTGGLSPTDAPASAAPSAAESAEDPTAACTEVEPDDNVVEISVQARSHAFDTQSIEGPRHCQPFVIEFTNLDGGGAPQDDHNIYIRLDGVLGEIAFEGETIGATTVRYEIPALPAGTHYFYCSIHASGMTGDLVVSEAET
jgi:plastocyanin